MTLAELRDTINELARKSSDSYFKGIMDFFKWTLTISLAALAWIGSHLSSTTDWEWIFKVGGLLCIILAIIISLIIIYYILEFWNRDWNINFEHCKWLTKDIDVQMGITTYSHEESTQRNQLIQQLVDRKNPLVSPDQFKWGVLIHNIFLLFGLILYCVSIVIAQGIIKCPCPC